MSYIPSNDDSAVDDSVSAQPSRWRPWFLYGTSFFAFVLSAVLETQSKLVTDLRFGASTVVNLVHLLTAVWVLTLAHIARTAVFDYVRLKPFWRKAAESPVGAGLALIAMALFGLSISIIIVGTYVSN